MGDARSGEGVGLEEVVVLVETVVAHLAEMGGRADRLFLEGVFGEEVSGADGDRGRVLDEVFGEVSPFRQDVLYVLDGIPLAEVQQVLDFHLLAFHRDVRFHLGAVIAQILKTALQILYRGVHQVGVIHHRRRADLAQQAVEGVVDLFPGPVIDKQHRADGSRLLLDVRLHLGGLEFLVVLRLYVDLGQPVFPLPQHTRRGTRHRCHQRRHYRDMSPITHINLTNLQIYSDILKYFVYLK